MVFLPIESHSQPNEIYQAVIALGRIAYINEEQVVENMLLGANNSFSSSFIQILSSGSNALRYRVAISGKLAFITPSTVDNPNGFYIVDFIENYTKIKTE